MGKQAKFSSFKREYFENGRIYVQNSKFTIDWHQHRGVTRDFADTR